MPSEPPPPWALDGSPAPLAGFRQNFPTFALISDPNILTVFERGIAANSQGKTCVLDKAHAYFHKRGMLASRSKEDCFARPFMGLTDLEMQQATMLYNQDMLNAHQMAVAQHTLAVANARAAALRVSEHSRVAALLCNQLSARRCLRRRHAWPCHVLSHRRVARACSTRPALSSRAS